MSGRVRIRSQEEFPEGSSDANGLVLECGLGDTGESVRDILTFGERRSLPPLQSLQLLDLFEQSCILPLELKHQLE